MATFGAVPIRYTITATIGDGEFLVVGEVLGKLRVSYEPRGAALVAHIDHESIQRAVAAFNEALDAV